LLHERAGGFSATFLVLAGFGSLVFVGALLFSHRPEELEVLPVQAQAAQETRGAQRRVWAFPSRPRPLTPGAAGGAGAPACRCYRARAWRRWSATTPPA